jgi:hypothetical protein
LGILFPSILCTCPNQPNQTEPKANQTNLT